MYSQNTSSFLLLGVVTSCIERREREESRTVLWREEERSTCKNTTLKNNKDIYTNEVGMPHSRCQN
jgi:hypothetical protein